MKTLTRAFGVTLAATLAAGIALPGAAHAAATATLQEKVAAIRALELEPEPTLTGLADCDLVVALWQRMDGKPFRDEVRADAMAVFTSDQVLAGDVTRCTAYIRTGVVAAKTRDLATEVRVKEEQRAELDLKRQAAQTIGIVADTAMLSLTVREYVWRLRELSTGEQVRATAEAAYNGTDAARITFLSTGIADAHDIDRRKQIEEEHADDLAEQLRLIEEDARKRALAILLIEATPGMLASTDYDLVYLIWQRATPRTEVRAAAEAALYSTDPGDWNDYIHDGIRDAFKRDVEYDKLKKYQADLVEIDAVITRAVSNGHYNLGHAAKIARLGTPLELDDFLRRGQHELDLTAGFESGQVVPTWTNSPTAPSGVKNVGGVCCDLKIPELFVGTTAHTGSKGLLYSGMDGDPHQSFAYLKAFNLSGVVVKPTTTLTYWINPQKYIGSANSSCVAIDLAFSDGRNLRDSGAKDRRGNYAHPAHQCGQLVPGQWNEVKIDLGTLFTGRTITRLNVGYDQAANTGPYRGFIDDITIAD